MRAAIRRARRWLPGLAALLLACAAAMPASAAAAAGVHASAEARLLAALAFARDGDYHRALDDISGLIEARPNFRLAQLVYAELLRARSGRTAPPQLDEHMRRERDALLAEAKSRWSHRGAAVGEVRLPAPILQLAADVTSAIVVDLSDNRLYLFANDDGRPRLVSDFYATIGSAGADKRAEGDRRTPVGVYHVTRFIGDAQLPELYGIGALPINYPNAFDRARGYTGSGIWVHGVPRATYVRTPRASEGCVVLANDNFQMLRAHVTVGRTPVILTDGLDWLPASRLADQRAAVLAALRDARRGGSGLGPRAFLDYLVARYAPKLGDVLAGSDDASGASIDAVPANRITLLRYPGQPDMVQAGFAGAGDGAAGARTTRYWRRAASGAWQPVLAADRD